MKSDILGDGSAHHGNRGTVPYSVFIDPRFRAGPTEAEARAKGFDVRIAKIPAAAVPKGAGAETVRRGFSGGD